VFLRANDVLVGVITGVIVAIIAGALEAYFITIRFMSFGQHGGAVGSKLGLLALIGAIAGGFIGLVLGAFIKPRKPPAR
jgi:hypothetical protein